MKVNEETLRNQIRKSLLVKEFFRKSRSADKYTRANLRGGGKSAKKGSLPDISNVEFESVGNSSAVSAAQSEKTFWGNGEKKENANTEEINQKLNDYWDASAYKPSGDPWSEAWSAAFMSYVMQKAGVNFKSPAHTTWATKALENRKALSEKPEDFVNQEIYVLFLRDEAEAVPGDIPFKTRPEAQGGISMDSWIKKGGGKTPSHSDVYVGNNMAIGGNLGQSVKEVKYEHPTIIKKIKVTGVKDST